MPTTVRSLLPQTKVNYKIFTDVSRVMTLEMKVINLALHYFLLQKQVKHVRIMTDNPSLLLIIRWEEQKAQNVMIWYLKVGI